MVDTTTQNGLNAVLGALATGGQPQGNISKLPSPVLSGLSGAAGGAGVSPELMPLLSPQALALMQSLGLIPAQPAQQAMPAFPGVQA